MGHAYAWHFRYGDETLFFIHETGMELEMEIEIAYTYYPFGSNWLVDPRDAVFMLYCME